MAVSGAYAIKQTLKEAARESLRELERPLFLELLFCSGGCVNGPGASQNAAGLLRRMRLLEYAESADDTLDAETLLTRIPMENTLAVNEPEQSRHREEEIRAALRQVGKFSVQDELNCSSCGYESCRDFAIACLDQHAEKTMCVSSMRNLAQKKANGLIRTIPSGVVIADKNGKIVECNRNFAHLMGKETEELFTMIPGLEGADLGKITQAAHYFTDVLAAAGGAANAVDSIECDIREGKKIFHLNVFVVEKGEIAAGVIDDITAPRIRRDKTVSRAQKVIDQNIAAVQKIAFLLGENAAETEAILHSIIEAHSPEEGA
jgi:PAS domain-containing protein